MREQAMLDRDVLECVSQHPRCELIFHLLPLSTSPRGDAVAVGYRPKSECLIKTRPSLTKLTHKRTVPIFNSGLSRQLTRRSPKRNTVFPPLYLLPKNNYPFLQQRNFPMRSILIHLWNTTPPAVEAAFPEKLVLNPSVKEIPGKWLLKIDDEIYLHISFYQTGPVELEDWNTRFNTIGSPPPVSISVSISDDHDGWDQTRDFALWLLSKFQGAAEDDSALRFWTHPEIEADQPINTQKFGAWRNYIQY
jgi:hypothetical protein